MIILCAVSSNTCAKNSEFKASWQRHLQLKDLHPPHALILFMFSFSQSPFATCDQALYKSLHVWSRDRHGCRVSLQWSAEAYDRDAVILVLSLSGCRFYHQRYFCDLFGVYCLAGEDLFLRRRILLFTSAH